MNIEIAGPLIPGTVNTLVDARSRVNTTAEIANIKLPAVGMIFYCVETKKIYVVNTLKSGTSNGYTIADSVIDTYSEVAGGTTYSGSDGISLKGTVFSIDWTKVAAKSHTHSGYAASSHTHDGYALAKHSHAAADISGLKTGLNYIYFDVPDESQINAEDRLYIEIDFANADDFSDAVGFNQDACQVFNPATGSWIDFPASGIDIAMAASKVRMKIPEESFINCRYRWSTGNGFAGSFNTVIF